MTLQEALKDYHWDIEEIQLQKHVPKKGSDRGNIPNTPYSPSTQQSH